MSETFSDSDEPVKGGPDYRRHTIAWKPAEWDRITEAAKRLSSDLHVDISEADLIKGAVLRRTDEVLEAA